MGSFVNAFETTLLKHILNETTWTPGTLYLAMLSAITDAEAGTVTECADSGYARKAITWDPVASGASANTTAITFNAIVDGTFTVVGVALYTAVSGGTPIMVDDVTSQALGIGDKYEIAIGNLDISLD